MTTNSSGWPRMGVLAAAFLLTWHAGLAAAEPPAEVRILDASDHAELAAVMSADGVVRVALLDDRIARVIRLPQTGFAVEHDPAAGDLYLRPVPQSAPQAPGTRSASADPQKLAAPQGPVALFVGSEKGSTYRLTLTPVAGGPAQILIRGVDAASGDAATTIQEEDRVAAIAGLIRAVADRSPPEGYVVEPAGPAAEGDIIPLELWRGPRLEALVLGLRSDAPADAPALAARLGPGVAAVWIRPLAGESGSGHPATTPHAVERWAVVVREASGQ